MSIRANVDQEVRRLGQQYGRELAAALVLASSGADVSRTMKRHMAELVLGQIGAMARKLDGASFPAELTRVYERGAREGVRDEILESRALDIEAQRPAA